MNDGTERFKEEGSVARIPAETAARLRGRLMNLRADIDT
jgi:hypothetical protein